MSKLAFFILVLFSLILESTLFTFPLTLLLVLVCFFTMEENIIIPIFVTGIIMDFFTGRPLGMDSLIFLLVCFVASRYQSKIYMMNIFYLSVFTAAVTAGYTYFFYRQVHILHLLVGILLVHALLWFVSRFLPDMVVYSKKISVG